MKSIVLILAVAALASAASKPSKLPFRNLYKKPIREVSANPNQRIIGGHEAVPHSVPSQAFLEAYSCSEAWYCGGSLISQNYVLTAGHCGNEAIVALITLGAHSLFQREDTQVHVYSTDIKVHEYYDCEFITNDLSVLKLSEPVTLTNAVQPATLPSSTDADNSYESSTARVSGWGLTDGLRDELANVLNYVDVKIISNNECEDYFGDLPESNICTLGDEDTVVCAGDSGGPLIVDGVQVGVVSFGFIFCMSGYPSGYARTASFLDWIGSNTDVQID